MKYIPDKKVALPDELSRVNSHEKIEMEGLNLTMHELTPCVIPLQISTVCYKQKKKLAIVELLV